MTELRVYVKNTFFEACSLDGDAPVLRRSGSCPSLSPSTRLADEDDSSSCARWADIDDHSAAWKSGGEEPSYDSDDDDDRLWPTPRLVVVPVAARPPDPALAAQKQEGPRAAAPPAARTRLSSKALAYTPEALAPHAPAQPPAQSRGDLRQRAPAGPGALPPPSGEASTTAMMRNLPCSMTRASLTKLLDRAGFAGCYDFLYMPVDFQTALSMGYAFVNMRSEEEFWRLTSVFQDWNAWPVKSAKVCSVSPSQTQGLEANIVRYQNSPVMGDEVPEKYKPALFVNHRKVPFPKPTKALPEVIERKLNTAFKSGFTRK